MANAKRHKKPCWDMSCEELREATKEFDRPIPLSKTRPLSQKEQALFERMRKSPQRSIFISRAAD
jgi:hypothetical protein